MIAEVVVQKGLEVEGMLTVDFGDKVAGAAAGDIVLNPGNKDQLANYSEV